jgi:DNA polymerase elongation subunit (family B)
MTKIGIVTAETLMVKNADGVEIPTVVLIGRDEKGNKKAWRSIFYPYLYVTEEDYKMIKEQDEYSLTKYVRETVGVRARTLTKKALTKIFLKDSKYVTGLVHFLRKYNKVTTGEPMYTYEGDLSAPTMLPIRFLIDKKIKSGVEIDDDGKLTPIDMNIKLRKWYIDFEALSSKQCGSGPKKDESIPIVSYYDNYVDTLYTLYVINPKWKTEPVFTKVNGKHCILSFKSEALVLDALRSMVEDYDPDLFTAWNLDRYDIIKWTQRMTANNLDPKSLSPFRSFSWKRIPYRIKGRILFDLMKAFKRFTDSELRSYALGAVSEEEGLNIDKIPLKKSIQWIWDNEPGILFQRNVNDVLILKALDDKYELVEMFDDLRKEFGALFSEVLLNYRVLDTALMRFINNKIVLKTSFKAPKNRESYLGALVIEPKPGEYGYIAQLDFNREYPSLMKAFNISPDTYREPGFKGQCYTITYGDKIFKFAKSPKGLLVQLIDFFFNKRDEYEKCYQEAVKSKDEVKIKMWYRKVFNIKKMTNAIYGVMDYPSFRLYRQECSAAVAILGRIGVEQIELILKGYGYELIYGDTDSSFVKLKSKDKENAVKEAKDIADKLNDMLSEYFKRAYGLPSAPSGLGVKKVYDSFLLIAKKNYAGRSFWDEKKGYKVDYDMKGLESIRSDSSDIEKYAIETIVKFVLNGDRKGVDITKFAVLDRVKHKDYTPLEVAYPLQLRGKLTDYPKIDKNGRKTMPSHVKASIYSNMFLNTDFDIGDKPRRLPIVLDKKKRIVKGQKSLFDEEIFPTEFKWKGSKCYLNGIGITEDLDIPKWFMDRISWGHIYKRLQKKIDKIIRLIK